MPKISALPTGTSLLGTEIVPIVQSATTKSFTATQIQTASPFVNGSDIYATLVAAIAALPTNGGKITIPAGSYTCSSTVTIGKYVWLEGQAAGENANNTPATNITWPNGVTGLLLQGDAASGTIISNLGLKATTQGGTVGHGVHMRVRATVQNCRIADFGEHGIHVEGEAPYNNVNGWQIRQCFIVNVGGSGVYVNGADANAGLCEMVDVVGAGAWGIFDSSFLGNTYIACQVDVCSSGAYKSDDPNARNVFLGCYSEGGQPGSSIAPPAVIYGGSHAAGFAGSSTGFYQLDEFMRYFTLPGTNASCVMGDRTNGDQMAAIYSGFSGSYPISLGWWNNTAATVEFRWNYADTTLALTTSNSATTFQDESSTPIPRAQIVFPQGIWLPSTAVPGKYKKLASI